MGEREQLPGCDGPFLSRPHDWTWVGTACWWRGSPPVSSRVTPRTHLSQSLLQWPFWGYMACVFPLEKSQCSGLGWTTGQGAGDTEGGHVPCPWYKGGERGTTDVLVYRRMAFGALSGHSVQGVVLKIYRETFHLVCFPISPSLPFFCDVLSQAQ